MLKELQNLSMHLQHMREQEGSVPEDQGIRSINLEKRGFNNGESTFL